MGQVTLTCCDICGGVADGDRIDFVRHYMCEHDICNQCQDWGIRHNHITNYYQCVACELKLIKDKEGQNE